MRRFPSSRACALAMGSAVRLTGSQGTGQGSSQARPSSTPPASPEGPAVDAKAAEDARKASELGAEAFEENTAILKQVAARGLRAFVVAGLGIATFSYAMRRRRAQEAAARGEQAKDGGKDPAHAGEEYESDPTQRYLTEMRGLGFDVDTLEEELEQERLGKLSKARHGEAAS